MSDATKPGEVAALSHSAAKMSAWAGQAFTAMWQRFSLSRAAASASLHEKGAAAHAVRPRLGLPRNLFVHVAEAQARSSAIQARMPVPHQLAAAQFVEAIAAFAPDAGMDVAGWHRSDLSRGENVFAAASHMRLP